MQPFSEPYLPRSGPVLVGLPLHAAKEPASPKPRIPRYPIMASAVAYLVFDTESVADAELVAALRYSGESLEPAEAVRRYRAELMEKDESDFIPYTFQGPI